MANEFRRVSPGMYQGPNGQIVRSQQRPVQRQAPNLPRGEIGPIGGYPPGMRPPPQPMGPQGPQVGGWRSGPNVPPPAPMGPPPPDQGMVGIGGFEQQQQQPYFGPPPRGFGDSFQGGQAGGGWQQPPMPQQGEMRSMIGRFEGPGKPVSMDEYMSRLPPGAPRPVDMRNPPPQGQPPEQYQPAYNRGAEMMRRSPLIGKIQGAKGPAGILTQPPKGNVF